MAITYSSFVALFPEFATDDAGEQARIAQYIGFAVQDVPLAKFGPETDRATAYLAAHLLTLANRKGGQGSVVSARVGQLAYSFGASASGVGSTHYGAEFERIRGAKLFTPVVLLG